MVKYEQKRFHPNLEDCRRMAKKRRERGREERDTEERREERKERVGMLV